MAEQTQVNRLWSLRVNMLAASALLTGEARERLYRKGGIDPNGTQIRPGCWFYSSRISFGTGGMINVGCWFENREHVVIGHNVYLGPQVLIATSTHRFGGSAQRAGEYAGQVVVIEDGCWIGARATILPGVTVGRGCMVAAGAVVTRSTEPDSLYGGVPARCKRRLE